MGQAFSSFIPWMGHYDLVAARSVYEAEMKIRTNEDKLVLSQAEIPSKVSENLATKLLES